VTSQVRVWWGASLVLGVVSCASRTTPFTGVEVGLDVAPSLASTPVTELAVTIGSVDGGVTYEDAIFPIDDAIDDAGAKGSAHFPTSFAIASNGNPNATVAFELAVFSDGLLLDDARYLLVHLPSTRVAQMRVLFAASCPSGPPSAGVVACPIDNACSWQAGYWLCDASGFPGPNADAGWPILGIGDAAPASDAAGDALANDASDASDASDATVPSHEDDGASASEGGDAASAGDTADDGAISDASAGGCVEDVDFDFDDDAAFDIPCEAGCDPGTQCVEGQCVPVPPSCNRGTPGAGHDCGLAGNDDCCASDEVPAGTFYRRYDGIEFVDMGAPASVSQFRLDRYEVTIGRFREFVQATTAASTAWFPDAGAGKHTHLHCGNGLSGGGDGDTTYETGWQTGWNAFLPSKDKSAWDEALLRADCQAPDGGFQFPIDPADWTPDVGLPDAGASELRPINCVTWYEAYAFCIWDGGFLPSDAEWDYAAAGGNQQRAFSWGSGGPYRNATYANYSYYYPPSTSGHFDIEGLPNIANVGTAVLGKGRWGQLDLTGNLYEFALDTVTALTGPLPVPCLDCAVTLSSSPSPVRLVHGGAWDVEDPTQIYNSFAEAAQPDNVGIDIGVRCARPPYP
jgi:sulfatase modifying factor 1